MTQLVVQDINPRKQYVAGAGDVDFVFPFLAFATTDITVYVVPVGTTPNDVIDVLPLSAYSVVLNPQPAVGGTVTLVTPSTAGDIVTIVRTQADQRLNYYIDGGLFTATMVNTDFDQEVLMIQQNKMYNTSLAPHYNLSDSPDAVVDIILPYLQPGYAWRKNSTNTAIEAYLPTAATPANPTSASALQITINQTAHGLTPGQAVIINVIGGYQPAQADNDVNAEVVGIVASVTNADTFVLHIAGMLTTGLSGLTVGEQYFLSASVAGALTLTPPTATGQVRLPLLVATGPTSGIWLNKLGTVI